LLAYINIIIRYSGPVWAHAFGLCDSRRAQFTKARFCAGGTQPSPSQDICSTNPAFSARATIAPHSRPLAGHNHSTDPQSTYQNSQRTILTVSKLNQSHWPFSNNAAVNTMPYTAIQTTVPNMHIGSIDPRWWCRYCCYSGTQKRELMRHYKEWHPQYIYVRGSLNNTVTQAQCESRLWPLTQPRAYNQCRHMGGAV
jgi:hypothetical protein